MTKKEEETTDIYLGVGHRLDDDGNMEYIICVECGSCHARCYSNIFKSEPTEKDKELAYQMFVDAHVVFAENKTWDQYCGTKIN